MTSSVECHLCSKPYQSLDRLAAHIVEAHGGLSGPKKRNPKPASLDDREAYLERKARRSECSSG